MVDERNKIFRARPSGVNVGKYRLLLRIARSCTVEKALNALYVDWIEGPLKL
jgi:hypothetical protein